MQSAERKPARLSAMLNAITTAERGSNKKRFCHRSIK
jgi:hypothetical protein